MSMDKYNLRGHQSTYSPNENPRDLDSDPYSPVIVEDLLQGVNEWRQIPDIVRLTFKALTEVVKAQGETVRELERQMPSRASKAELNSGLAMKANVTDVSKTIAEIAGQLDNKLSTEETQSLLRDYVLRSDFQYLMSSKASIDEVRVLLDTRISNQEYKNEIRTMNDRLEEIYRETTKKISNVVSQREFQALQAAVDLKVNLTEFNEQMENKANKQSVANALHRKMNRSDVEAMLARKAETSDIQNVLVALDNKAEVHAVEKMNQLLEMKIDRSDMNLLANNLSNKAEKTDFELLHASISNLKLDIEHRLHGLERIVESSRIEASKSANKRGDLDFINNTVMKCRNDLTDELSSIRAELNLVRRNTEDTFGENKAKSEAFYEKFSEEVYKLNDQLKNILEDRRNDIEETAKFVKNISNTTKKDIQITTDRIFSEIEELKRGVEDLITRKIEKKDWLEQKAKITALLDGKVDLVEVQSALNTCQADLSARFMEYKEDIKGLIRNHENEIFQLLSKKANLSDVNQALNGKADHAALHQMLSQKAGLNEYDDIRKKLDVIHRGFEEKIGFRGRNTIMIKEIEFEDEMNHVRKVIDDVQKEILLKANIKDVCTLLDTKSNIDDVNKALIDIHKDLDSKSNLDELNNIVNDQALINESLCTENIVGRWAWKSGDLKSGSTVPWEIQLSNTLPDNFLWEKDKSSILTVAPGLYEISFGFFAKKKPTVQVLINGEPILSAVNTSSYVIHHSSGKMKDVGQTKHPSGNVTGLTMIDFVVLPARARISITYTGEPGAEGFLSLKRL